MSELTGQIGELRMVVTITRAATGKQETFELVGNAVLENEQTQEEPANGSDPLDGSA